MDTTCVVENYEFTLSPLGALLSFDPPIESIAARPRGLPNQPAAVWSNSGPAGEPELALTYPNLPRPARLIFRNPPHAMALHLESQAPFIACQTRNGTALRAHLCQTQPCQTQPLAPPGKPETDESRAPLRSETPAQSIAALAR